MQHRFSIPFVGGWTTVMESEEFNKKKQQVKKAVVEYVHDIETSLEKNPRRALLVSAGWGLGVGVLGGVVIKAAVLTGIAKVTTVVGTMIFSGATAPVVAAKVNDWCDYTSELELYSVSESKSPIIDAA